MPVYWAPSEKKGNVFVKYPPIHCNLDVILCLHACAILHSHACIYMHFTHPYHATRLRQSTPTKLTVSQARGYAIPHPHGIDYFNYIPDAHTLRAFEACWPSGASWLRMVV